MCSLRTGASSGAAGRRHFLLEAGRWGLAVVLGALAYPLARFLGFSVPRQPREIHVGKLNPAGFHIDKDFVLFVEGERAWAVSRRCTHLGCLVAYNETEGALVCPCHHSRFSRRGARLAGPARRDLPVYQVKPGRDGGYIVVI